MPKVINYFSEIEIMNLCQSSRDEGREEVLAELAYFLRDADQNKVLELASIAKTLSPKYAIPALHNRLLRR